MKENLKSRKERIPGSKIEESYGSKGLLDGALDEESPEGKF